MDFYVGPKNLTNYFQKNPIVASDQPFSTYFDASRVWGRLQVESFMPDGDGE